MDGAAEGISGRVIFSDFSSRMPGKIFRKNSDSPLRTILQIFSWRETQRKFAPVKLSMRQLVPETHCDGVERPEIGKESTLSTLNPDKDDTDNSPITKEIIQNKKAI